MRRIINKQEPLMDQGSSDWHAWRSKGIGGSEIAAVLGLSPWMTAYQLWEQKTGRSKKDQSNWATQRGVDMEPRARASYELEHNEDMPPCLAEHKDYPFLRVSLDGHNEKLSRILEIKYNGKKNHELALKGEIPDYYMAQIQMQLAVTGANHAHYYSYDGQVGITITVLPDLEWIERIIRAGIEFWEFVTTDTPPPFDLDKDYERVNDPALEAYCGAWKNLKTQYDEIKLEMDEVEEKIRSGLQVPRAICYSLRLTKSKRKGSVDYQRVPQLQGLNLEEFRKPDIDVFSIRAVKER